MITYPNGSEGYAQTATDVQQGGYLVVIHFANGEERSFLTDALESALLLRDVESKREGVTAWYVTLIMQAWEYEEWKAQKG